MNAYKLVADSNTYAGITFKDEHDCGMTELFNGEGMIDNWEPPMMSLIARDDSNKKLKIGDFPSLLRRVPVLSNGAWEKLNCKLSPCCQAFPMREKTNTYWALNVFSVDIIDKEKSEFELMPSTNRIFGVNKFVFRKKNLPLIFKLPETAMREVYVSEEFIGIVDNEGLLGFDFKKLPM